MPVQIDHVPTLARIHQNDRIAFLLDAGLPLTLEPGTSAVLSAMLRDNERNIVRHLRADAAFIARLFDALTTHLADAHAALGQVDGSDSVGDAK
eukprot:5262522-Pleurochrysis_carterae.AAC.1